MSGMVSTYDPHLWSPANQACLLRLRAAGGLAMGERLRFHRRRNKMLDLSLGRSKMLDLHLFTSNFIESQVARSKRESSKSACNQTVVRMQDGDAIDGKMYCRYGHWTRSPFRIAALSLPLGWT